jgi:hypothetical protein
MLSRLSNCAKSAGAGNAILNLYFFISSKELQILFLALFGQLRIHSPQSMQRSESITAQPLRILIASVGQCFIQVVQPVHLLGSSATE